MRTVIERRLRALEGRQHDREAQLTPEQQQAAFAARLEHEGTTEAEVIAQYGSVGGWCHFLMCRPDPGPASPPVSGDRCEAYRRLCDGLA